MHQSAQEFTKANLRRIKQQEQQELQVHAAIKRKEFEEREKKIKEGEIKDKEYQMSKLEQERELLKKDFVRHEQHLKELNR